MKLPCLTGLAALALGVFAAAQDQAERLRPVPGPVRNAGIFHTASGTWTRKATLAAIGADIVYDNTASSGYFSALSGETYVDEGRLPSPTSPTNAVSRTGCSTAYTIDGVQIGYCTDTALGIAFTLDFYESYASCTSTTGLTPQASLVVVGPPAVGTICTLLCWTVTVDLDPANGFVLHADGDGTYGGAADTFGWQLASTLPSWDQLSTGPIIAGNPGSASHWDGTRWDSPVNYLESGTGMGSLDQYRVESGPSGPGCATYQGNPFASFHLELYADACGAGTPSGTPFCFGDGSGTPCPCANHGVAGNGCANSLFAAGARLFEAGNPSMSNDTVVLTCENTPNASVLFFQGTIQQSGGAGAQFGDGKRCAGGTTIRLGTETASANTAWYPGAGDAPISARGGIVIPGTRTYQAWYRNAASFCTAATFNLSNGAEVAWSP